LETALSFGGTYRLYLQGRRISQARNERRQAGKLIVRRQKILKFVPLMLFKVGDSGHTYCPKGASPLRMSTRTSRSIPELYPWMMNLVGWEELKSDSARSDTPMGCASVRCDLKLTSKVLYYCPSTEEQKTVV
jgi:hypothetical protein